MRKNIKGPFGEEIIFLKKIPLKILKDKDSFWFVDSVFKKRPEFKIVKNVYFLKAGEDLKTFKSLDKNLKFLLKNQANRSSKIYCVGGGSLGDSIGFLCSIYMRGVPFYSIPTTWLACVDSSIGGKTALNYEGAKNLIGSFYPPHKNLYIEDLVVSSKVKDAEGEILKTLFLNHNKKWAQDLLSDFRFKKLSFPSLERFVKYKTQIVKEDPEDKTGVRAVLNLGHTLGHAIELNKKVSHSRAVIEGLRFSLKWSKSRRYLSKKTADELLAYIDSPRIKINKNKVYKALLKDKKVKNKNEIDFIFLGSKGPVVKKVKTEQVIKEFEKQGLNEK